ncbi:MAG TPA: hypothetical protein PLZ51_04295, partial [Aggregatilineales bacterium]|nr:hypothetical protein [Aggregatilineales bacterium]
IQAATATYRAENTEESTLDVEITAPVLPNILLVASDNMTLYAQPNTTSEALLPLIINDIFTVYGVHPNGQWFYVENIDGIYGWIERFANDNLDSVVLGTPVEELPMLDPEDPKAPSEELFGVHLIVTNDIAINVREYASFDELANVFAGLQPFSVARIDATTPAGAWLRVSFVTSRNRTAVGWVSATLVEDGGILIIGDIDTVIK